MPLSPGPRDPERLHGGCRRPQLARLCVCRPDGLGSHPTAALGPVWVSFLLLTPQRQRPLTIFKSPKATRSRAWPPSVGARVGGAGCRWDRVGTGQCEDELSAMTTARNCFVRWQAPCRRGMQADWVSILPLECYRGNATPGMLRMWKEWAA